MLDPCLIAPEKLRPLKRVEYDRMVEMGLFEDERVELLHGALVQMTPQGSRHAEVVRRLNRLFLPVLGGRAEICVQMPLAISEDSEPEPDFAIVPPGDYSEAHPATALLVVEVADSSRKKDREIKSALYAAAGIPEYWLVDQVERVVEVRTRPSRGRYRSLTTFDKGVLRPQAFPKIGVKVSDLLP